MDEASTTSTTLRPGMRLLSGFAVLVVAIAGLKLGGDLLIPILVAAFVAIICAPAVTWLERRGVPGWLSVAIVLVVVLGAIVLLTTVVVSSLVDLSGDLPAYEQRLQELVQEGTAWLEGHGVHLQRSDEPRVFEVGKVLSALGSAAGTTVSALSSVLLVLLIVIFMLAESRGMPAKIRRALHAPDADLSKLHEIAQQLWTYLGLKTAISLVTGVLFGLILAVVGVKYAVLWGLLAFALNFIPNIGSALAAIPPVLLALIQPGLENSGLLTIPSGVTAALVVGIGNLAVNQVIGNVVEPKLMGARLGLSPLVVFLSLIFWSWLWGPVGMLLSVPLTQVMKIVFENLEDFRGVAVLLGPNPDDGEAAAAGATPS